MTNADLPKTELQQQFGVVPDVQEPGFWKSSRDDPDVTSVEHEEFCDELEPLVKEVATKVSSEGEIAIYVRCDFFEERTEEVYVNPENFVDHAHMIIGLARKIQHFLRKERSMWRVVIPFSSRRGGTLMIYPSAFCTDRILSNSELDERVRALLRESWENQQRQVERQRARLDKARPLLPDAYSAAMKNPACVQLVTCLEPECDGRRFWAIHRYDGDEFDLDEYETNPELTHEEIHRVAGDGSIASDDFEALRPDALLLVLWIVEDTSVRQVTFKKKGHKTSVVHLL